MGFARWTLLAVCAASLACAEEEAPPPGGVEAGNKDLMDVDPN